MGQGRRTTGRLLGTVVLAVATTVATFAGGAGSAAAAPPDGATVLRRLVAAERGAAGADAAHRAADHRVSPHARVAAQRAQEQAVAAEDDAVDLSLAPSCATTAKAKVKTSAYLYSPVKATYDYVLTSTSGLRKTGSIKAKKDDVVRASLPTLRTGTYRVVLTLHGATASSADETFRVLPCVQVKASCAAITLTNPSGNPAALVAYGYKDADTFDVELAPGESRTVRIDDKSVRVEATSADDEDTYVDLGSSTVKVKQSCKHGPAQPGQNAVQSSTFVGCGSASAPGSTTFFWSAQKSLKKGTRTWEVVGDGPAPVASGPYKNGGATTASLAPGSYTYRSYANGIVKPFEEIAFSVLECVTATPTCRAVDVTNPNAVAVEAYLVDAEDGSGSSDDVDLGEDVGPTTVAAGSTATIPWSTGKAVLLAIAGDLTDRSGFVVLASAFPLDDNADFPVLTVPQDC